MSFEMCYKKLCVVLDSLYFSFEMVWNLLNLNKLILMLLFEPPHEKINNLHMRKRRHRSASQ